jgi:hypothetical protein
MADLLFQDGDMAIIDGELSFVTGPAAIAQHIQMRLQTWLGETPYDTAAGVPYLQVIFVKSTPLDSVQFILEQQVLATPGVLGVDLELSLDSQTRLLTVTGTATSIDGDVDFTVAVSPQGI